MKLVSFLISRVFWPGLFKNFWPAVLRIAMVSSTDGSGNQNLAYVSQTWINLKSASPRQIRLAGAQLNLKNTWKLMVKSWQIVPLVWKYFLKKNVYYENFQKTQNLDFCGHPGASNCFPQEQFNYYASNFGSNFNLRSSIWAPQIEPQQVNFNLTQRCR